MYRFFLCGILVFSATLLGNWFSQRLFRRTRYLQGMLEGINRMKTNVCFGNLDVFRAVGDSFPAFRDNSCEETSAEEYWASLIDSIPKSSGLSKADREVLKGFGRNLGVTDTEGQLNNCELYSGLVLERIKISKEEEASKSRLYRVLGFSLGFAITLLIV